MNMKKVMAAALAAGMVITAQPAFAEDAQTAAIAEEQKLDANYTLALNAINAEDYETAIRYLNICFAYCDPQSNPAMYADLLLKRACIDVINKENDIALVELDAALKVDPKLADAYLVKAQIYADGGDITTSAENLEKYIELTEDTSLYETVAQLYEANGDLEQAESAYSKFVEGKGEEVEEAGFQTGLYRMEGGKYEEAIEAFEEYADDETYGSGAMYNIGVCRMSLSDYAGAVEAFSSCEEKGGTYEGLYYNRGTCSLLTEDWESAEADFKKSIETEPYVTDSIFNLGICQMQLEKYEEAIESFTKVIGDGEEEPAEAAEGETEEAEAPAEEAAAATVNYGAYYYRAVCYAAIGKLEESLADYTTCIDNEYEIAQSYYQRAQVYAAMGDTENQTSDLEASLKYAE